MGYQSGRDDVQTRGQSRSEQPFSACRPAVPAASTQSAEGAVAGATSYPLQEQVNGGGWTVIQSSGATARRSVARAMAAMVTGCRRATSVAADLGVPSARLRWLCHPLHPPR